MRETLRALGIHPGRLRPGASNTLLDVPGTRIGHVTLMAGEGPLRIGEGPVRTGVTAIFPVGEGPWRAEAAVHVINGYGKTMGLMQVAELGTLEAPVFLTNTLGVGAVQQGALRAWRARYPLEPGQSLNVVVGECNDGYLNDLWGLHVTPAHAEAAWATALRGDSGFLQGGVGAGTGMAGFGYKGGIGMSSRVLSTGAVLGGLVLLNCGAREDLRGGAPGPASDGLPDGSIIIVLAGNLALGAWDLTRVARRATHGLARTGATSAPHSGDVVLIWDTGQEKAARPALEEAFLAAAEVTEEAIWNALACAESMEGRDGRILHAIPQTSIRRAWA